MRQRIGGYLALAALVIFFFISLPTFEPRVFGFIRQALSFEVFTAIHEFLFPSLLIVGVLLLWPEVRQVRTLAQGWSPVRRVSFWIVVVGVFLFGIAGTYIGLEKEFDVRILPDAARPPLVMLMSLGVSLFYVGFPAFFIRTIMDARGGK